MSKNIYTGQCPKCQKHFIKEIKWGYKPKFCSRKCANSRTISGPERIIYKHTKVYIKPCKRCNTMTVFSKPKNNSYKKYCYHCSLYLKNIYMDDCRFSLSPNIHPELYNNSLLIKHNWFHPINNKNGVCWDHLYRIIDGFQSHINPKIISHPANAEMVTMKENMKRRLQSSITIDELYTRINLWNSGRRILQKTW